jgi:predicted RNase H-like nuclease (RuvC/YqgF family)
MRNSNSTMEPQDDYTTSFTEAEKMQHDFRKIDVLEGRVSLLEAENRELREQLDSASKSILAIPEHLVRVIETVAHMWNELKLEISLLEKDTPSDRKTSREQFQQYETTITKTQTPRHVHQGHSSQTDRNNCLDCKFGRACRVQISSPTRCSSRRLESESTLTCSLRY